MLNCTRILVPRVRDLTPGKNTTCPGASYASKEEAKKIAIRKQFYLTVSRTSTPPHHAAFDVIVEFDSYEYQYLGKGVKVSPEIQPCVGPISHFCDVFLLARVATQDERNHD
jgi:hypothetical protein